MNGTRIFLVGKRLRSLRIIFVSSCLFSQIRMTWNYSMFSIREHKIFNQILIHSSRISPVSALAWAVDGISPWCYFSEFPEDRKYIILHLCFTLIDARVLQLKSEHHLHSNHNTCRARDQNFYTHHTNSWNSTSDIFKSKKVFWLMRYSITTVVRWHQIETARLPACPQKATVVTANRWVSQPKGSKSTPHGRRSEWSPAAPRSLHSSTTALLQTGEFLHIKTARCF